MEIEEAELGVLDGSVLPREEVRVRNCRIDSGPGLNDSSSSGHRVTFYTMPEGVGGRWWEWEKEEGRGRPEGSSCRASVEQGGAWL